jgi:hypothetical protein
MELGGDLGPPALLLGPDHRNPRGYFENKEVLAANIRLLLGDLVSPQRWIEEIEHGPLPLPLRWLTRLSKLQYFLGSRLCVRRARVQGDTLARLAAKYRNKIVKDIRFCSTLDVWRQRAPVSRVIFVLRPPAEVVRSMRAAYGLPLWAGYRFWRQQVTSFFIQVAGIPLVIVDYAALMSPSMRLVEARRVCRFLGTSCSDGELEAALAKVMDSDLQHHVSSPVTRVPPKVAALYDRLRRYHARHSEPIPFDSSAV